MVTRKYFKMFYFSTDQFLRLRYRNISSRLDFDQIRSSHSKFGRLWSLQKLSDESDIVDICDALRDFGTIYTILET